MAARTREFELLTRKISRTRNHLLAFQGKTVTTLERTDGRFDRLDGKLDALDRKIDAKVDGLRRDLPNIVGDAMREVLNGRKK